MCFGLLNVHSVVWKADLAAAALNKRDIICKVSRVLFVLKYWETANILGESYTNN